MSDLYLVWSHEHSAWWGPGGCGYVRRVSQAGRYTKADALTICADGIPGNATRQGALPQLPVALADVEEILNAYQKAFPHLDMPAREPFW